MNPGRSRGSQHKLDCAALDSLGRTTRTAGWSAIGKSVHDRGERGMLGRCRSWNLPAPVVPPAREEDSKVGD